MRKFAKKAEIFSREKRIYVASERNRSAAQIRSAAQKRESARRLPFLAKNAGRSDFRFFENKRSDGFFRRIATFLRGFSKLRRLPKLTLGGRRLASFVAQEVREAGVAGGFRGFFRGFGFFRGEFRVERDGERTLDLRKFLFR